MSTGQAEKHSFQAEVKQVLDIVVNSLYTDKDIFIRELVSNASDALEKLRHVQLQEKEVFDENLDLEINLTTDENAKTLTFQDFGIGMTREDLVENLGTIAHSGSKAFMEALKQGGERNENLIGQFGVGFYSVFMVAKEVKVFTRNWQPEGEGLLWTCDGSSDFTIEPSEGQRRGTKIVVYLKDEYEDFAKKDRVKGILEQYSSFVQFPVNLNGERVNTQEAIWLKSKSDISEDDYKAFYKYQAHAFDEPMDWLHFSADAPLAINALLYIPSENPERFGMGRQDPSVALHCRKVLIDSHPEKLLPEWLRFLRGVVDSADLPLNISRESMQDSALVAKLGNVLTRRFLKRLEELAKKETEKYNDFYRKFGVYLKEGVSTDFSNREKLSSLLRFESTATEKGELTSLQAYVDRMKDGQKEIYYLNGPNRQALENGPYLEAFKARGLEVLFCYEPIDDFVMSHVGQFDEKRLISADQDDLDLGESETEATGEPLEKDALEGLCKWLKDTLGEEKVARVDEGKRLVDSPALALNADKMMSASMRRMMRVMNPDMGDAPQAVNLQVNARHPLIRQLATLREKDTDTAKLVAEQIYDNALIAAGMLEDPRRMTDRIYTLLEKLSAK